MRSVDGANPPSRARVQLIAFEAVVDNGTRKTSWLLHHDGRWVSPRHYPGVQLEQLDAGPGTIWQTAATLLLPVGSWVQRVQSMPQRAAHRDPLRYLQQERRGMRRRVARSYFRVRASGQLAPVAKGDEVP